MQKPRLEGGVCKSTGVDKEDLLVIFLLLPIVLMLFRRRRTRFQLTIEL